MISLQYLFEYDSNYFSYSVLSRRMWRDLIHKAKKDSKIWFDLENDDTTKQQKDITIDQNYWTHSTCKFRCELFSAGGDWEYPVYYFRCQLISGYALNLSQYGNSHFVYIPSKTEGNYHLIPGRKDSEWRAPHDGEYKKGIDPEREDKPCWKALKQYLQLLVDKEIERISTEDDSVDSDNSKPSSRVK